MTPVKSTFTPWKIRELEHGDKDVQPKREISSVVTVQGVNGLGLLVTAVIQTALGKLSLYHAFLVINLLFLLSTSFLYFLFNRTSPMRQSIRISQFIASKPRPPSSGVLPFHLDFTGNLQPLRWLESSHIRLATRM